MWRFLFIAFLIEMSICAAEDYLGNLTSFQKDQIIACSFIIGNQLDIDKKTIEELSNKTNVEFNKMNSKLSYEMLELCLDKIDNKTVQSISKNLTISDFSWKNSMSEFVNLNYSKYTNETVFELTLNQNILAKKFSEVQEEVNEKRIEYNQEKRKHINIGSFQVDSISPNAKLLIFFGFFGFSGFVIYYLMSIVTKKKEKKKKKKKSQ